MPADGLHGIDTWIFDLDNTLYPPQARLFDQIDGRMRIFIAETLSIGLAEADFLRRDYWVRYGTTLAGLRRHHDIDPGEFLHEVHRIDLGDLVHDERLAGAISSLPGRKIVHTNGPRAHADRVLAARGLSDVFDACFGIDDLSYHSKPEVEAYQTLADLAGHDPIHAVMIEDSVDNLRVPKRMGMRTVLISAEVNRPAHVDVLTDDLTGFLAGQASKAASNG